MLGGGDRVLGSGGAGPRERPWADPHQIHEDSEGLLRCLICP